MTGKKSKKQAYTDFMQQWDRSRDGLVTYQEFEDYYEGTVLNPSDHIY